MTYDSGIKGKPVYFSGNGEDPSNESGSALKQYYLEQGISLGPQSQGKGCMQGRPSGWDPCSQLNRLHKGPWDF